ncbi:MAG: hypothetical protein HYU66_00755 [Armatimonadetes bacterium]|nr:hypothetical protein [Armatimonadota bacterium]
MVVGRGGKSWDSTAVTVAGHDLTVAFGDSGMTVTARADVYLRYFTVVVTAVTGDPDWLQLCNLAVTCGQHSSTMVNAAWDDRFAACVLACNDRTDGGSHGPLTARAYREYGLVGAKVAVLGVPTGVPEPEQRLLDCIETVELGEGLPHPMVDGVWIKRAPRRLESYLMVVGITPANIDEVIDFAKGGFGCIELDWWHSTPTYEPNRTLFPGGLRDMVRVADKIHAAGLQVGLHVMSGMVGWGSKDDPYIVPQADPRLLQDRRAALSTALDATATEVAVTGPVADWPPLGDLYVEGEIIRYTAHTANGFGGCLRGLHGTTIGAHPAATPVGHLVNCWREAVASTVYCPDVNSTLIDEICDNMARVFNATGADMSYFDAGEELLKQPPAWRNQGRFALGVQARLRKPVFIGGNAPYSHLPWHVLTRGAPHFDPIYFGRREYTLRFKGTAPAGWADHLLDGDVGWFQPHTHSLVTDAVTPDEMMLLCLKALGFEAPVSILVDARHLWANGRMPEMLDIIRTCDDLKRRRYFSPAARAELVRPRAEHTLERAADGGWDLRSVSYDPPRAVDATRPDEREWASTNPYAEQTPFVRLRARTALAPAGAEGNLVLADPARGDVLKADGTAAPELVQSVEPSDEKTPDGGASFCYRVENRGAKRSDWAKLTLPLAPAPNLTKHRRLAVWVRAEAPGGILNVQLQHSGGDPGLRDHYLALDRPGWIHHLLDQPEDVRFYDYRWPYNFMPLMYTPHFVYHAATELNLYLNGLPAGGKAVCWIGRIEALAEKSLPLVSPALSVGEQKLTFPVTLQPDEYVELGYDGRCRHYEPDGKVLAEVQPAGRLRLATGEHQVRYGSAVSDAASPRGEVTLGWRGAPLADARRAAGPGR